MNSRGETGLVPESYLEVSVSESESHCVNYFARPCPHKISTFLFTSVPASVSCSVLQESVFGSVLARIWIFSKKGVIEIF